MISLRTALAALLFLVLGPASPTFAQTASPEATLTTSSAGTVSELQPGFIYLKSDTSPDSVRYAYSKTTTYEDESGHPVSLTTLTAGTPVTIYSMKLGDKMVASRVIIRSALLKGDPTIEKKETPTN